MTDANPSRWSCGKDQGHIMTDAEQPRQLQRAVAGDDRGARGRA